MKQETRSITVADKGDIDSIWLVPEDYQAILIIAHGAGSDMHSPLHQLSATQHRRAGNHDRQIQLPLHAAGTQGS